MRFRGAARRSAKEPFVFDPYPLVRPWLHRLDPERAHELTLQALALGMVPPQPVVDDPALAVTLFGKRLPNPVGLAAGFDKNARVFARMFAQGFGHVEIGGVTPRAQRGNPRPRVFRLPHDAAVINRMGFPNDGMETVAARLRGTSSPGMLGINLASNSDSAEPAADFVALVERFAPFADYLTLDISCPNTANGQVFLDPGCLDDLLARLVATERGGTPLVAKLSPDIDDALLIDLLSVLLARRIDGIIVSNTTSARPPLRDTVNERGGLSGAPLFAASTALLARVAAIVNGAIPLIGVGGITSGADAYAKIRAGATVVQLYTGLIYAGTRLVTAINRDLVTLLQRDGFTSVHEAIGADRLRRKVAP